MISRFLQTLLGVRRVYITVGLGFLLVLTLIWALLFDAPRYFPAGEVVTIPQGATTTEIALLLEEKNVIESKKVFLTLTRTIFNGTKIDAGDYVFSRPVGPLVVAYRIANGILGVDPVTITFAEGLSTREMAEVVHQKFPHISVEEFRSKAGKLEGYLFPDTYRFVPGVSAQTIIDAMQGNFERRIVQLENEYGSIDRPLHDVVTMASILEKEARQFRTMQIVAGVLYQRLEIGMALQVDATFGYILDRDTFHPNFEQLEIDSPYNTYKYPGLPPGPIANPGLVALRAAIDPIATDYLFYLTGRDGNMYYAETFDGHRRNRALYLD